MIRLALTVYFIFLTIFVVTSSAVHEPNELNEKVRSAVEAILQEKQMTDENVRIGRNLEGKVERLENKLKEMEEKIAEQDTTIADLKNIIKELERGNDKDAPIKSQNENHHLNSEAGDIENIDVHNLITSGHRVKRATTNVAFSAYLSVTNSHTVIGQPVKFDRVLLNDGQGYNNYTGSFTVPVAGVYLFTFAIDSGKSTFVKLVVNGVNQVDVVANPHNNVSDKRLAHSMGGNAAIVRVRQGDAVLVETYENADAQTSSSDTFRLCTFSGVLLY